MIDVPDIGVWPIILMLFVMFFTGITVGIFCGIQSTEWHAEAISHKAAHYDAVTGKFTWNDENKP